MTKDEFSKRQKAGELKARSMKSPMYGNCLVVAPNGTPLFRCQEHRVEWYMTRNLAEKISDDPMTIRLLFNPKGYGNAGDEYMLGCKVNACVVCGTEDNLTRHHVVPYCYKTHFCRSSREHVSYDIFPLCIPCHEQYERHARLLKEQIFIEYGVREVQIQVDEVALAAVRSAKALLKHHDSIPLDRQVKLMGRVAAYFKKNWDDICKNDIVEASKLVVAITPDNHVKASAQVVQKLADYNEFAKRWRQHFITIMNPKFIPATWDVNKKIYSKP